MLDKNISNFCIPFTILDSSSRRKLVRYEILFSFKKSWCLLVSQLEWIENWYKTSETSQRKHRGGFQQFSNAYVVTHSKLNTNAKSVPNERYWLQGSENWFFFVYIGNDYIFDSLMVCQFRLVLCSRRYYIDEL